MFQVKYIISMNSSSQFPMNCQFIFRYTFQKWRIPFLLMLTLGCGLGYGQNIVAPTPPPFDINNVEIMFWQNEQILWVGNRGGIARLSRTGESSEMFPGLKCYSPVITYDPELIWCNGNMYDGSVWLETDPNIGSPLQTPDKTIWAGSKSGLAKFDVTSRSWDYVLHETSTRLDTAIIFNNPGPGVHLQMITQDEALWFNAYTGKYAGVNRWTSYEPLTWPMYSDDSILVPRFEASDGSVWAVQEPPYQNDIARWDRHKWEFMNPFSDIGLPVFLEAMDQTVWIASMSHEVGRWNSNDWQIWSPFSANANIIDILEASDGTIWIISGQNSVGRWNGQNWQTWDSQQITFQSDTSDKEIETCNPSDTKTVGSTDTAKHTGSKVIEPKHILEDSTGNIWFNLFNQKGISRWTGECWRHYTTNDELNSNAVSILTVSPDGVLWAGTRDAGINYYDPNTDKWQSFP